MSRTSKNYAHFVCRVFTHTRGVATPDLISTSNRVRVRIVPYLPRSVATLSVSIRSDGLILSLGKVRSRSFYVYVLEVYTFCGGVVAHAKGGLNA